jgi:hypothetical protein
MNIIGINAYHGDASAALVVNGQLVAAVEEERFNRIKHWAGFPSQSIQYCLVMTAFGWKADVQASDIYATEPPSPGTGGLTCFSTASPQSLHLKRTSITGLSPLLI